MKILAIETSCDDTGIAVLEIKENKSPSFSVLSNIISSQTEVHKKYGGVYPAMAKREHQKNLVPVLIKALKEAKLLKQKVVKNFAPVKNLAINKILEREQELAKKIISFLKKYEKPDIDLIAVTNGPGLEPCLWVGINFAKALSYFWNIPVVPVNHIEAHILVNFLDKKIKFPAIALVVSGGHTQIILIKKPFDLAQGKFGKYKIIGETRDDAAGECFDKCAKILGLSYPGGPIIAKLASHAVIPSLTGNPELTTQALDSRFRGNDKLLPRPMINTKDYDFSFSGLKTAVLYKWQKINSGSVFGDRQKPYRNKIITAMAKEIQQAIIDVLLKKTIKAAKDYKAKTIILGGGVSANSELRSQFQSAVSRHCEEFRLAGRQSNLSLIFPPINLSTDNALMTAITGYFHKYKKIPWQKIGADANLRLN